MRDFEAFFFYRTITLIPFSSESYSDLSKLLVDPRLFNFSNDLYGKMELKLIETT